MDVNGTGWANIRIVVATENGWQTVVDSDDQSAGYAVELRETRRSMCPLPTVRAMCRRKAKRFPALTARRRPSGQV
ncbi:MAG: hypothetical protein ACLS7Z_09930 [Christensenellales bacterium]